MFLLKFRKSKQDSSNNAAKTKSAVPAKVENPNGQNMLSDPILKNVKNTDLTESHVTPVEQNKAKPTIRPSFTKRESTISKSSKTSLTKGDTPLTKGDTSHTEAKPTIRPSFTKRESTISKSSKTSLTKGDTPLTRGETPLTKGDTPLTKGDTSHTEAKPTIRPSFTKRESTISKSSKNSLTKGETTPTKGETPLTKGETPLTRGETPLKSSQHRYSRQTTSSPIERLSGDRAKSPHIITKSVQLVPVTKRSHDNSISTPVEGKGQSARRASAIRTRLERMIIEFETDPKAFNERANKAFTRFDLNNDGSLDFKEVMEVVRSMSASFCIPCPSPKIVERIFNKFDIELDGKLAINEFHHFYNFILYYCRDTHYPPRIKFRRAIFITKKTGKIDESYTFCNKFGQGQFGVVYKVMEKVSGSLRCCKTISKNKSNAPPEQIENEIGVIKVLDHPHIVRLFECFEDYHNIYMIFELCEGQELLALLLEHCRNHKSISEYMASHMMHSIISAVSHCHKNRIMHKDLKPENVIIDTSRGTESGDIFLKIIDFGLAEMFVPGTMSNISAGTPYYMAPEVFSRQFNYKCDVWSCGIIMYLMLTGHLPFDAPDKEAYAKVVKRQTVSFPPDLFKHVSSEAVDLIKHMLTKDPNCRPSASEALQHPWFLKRNTLKTTPNMVRSDTILNFTAKSSLKRACMNLVAMNINFKELKKAPALFKSLDTDCNGCLSHEELTKGLAMLGLPEAEVPKIIVAMDADGSGEISYTEFIASLVQVGSEAFEDNLWNAFRQFDINGDGTITSEEFRFLMNQPDTQATFQDVCDHSARDVDELVAEIDSNKDGVINFDEFCDYLRKTDPPPTNLQPESDII
eukprot:GHVL01024630.1.p1 GENE.GHVL01024630.1~~GHVL01024630.1.p1  ORF type:complete len:861 (+),score=107.62 GHVL01024630.1:31-2613(+)